MVGLATLNIATCTVKVVFLPLIADYILVTPVKVDPGGSSVQSNRDKRSAPVDSLHYKLSFSDQELHLDLRASNVLAKGFTVHLLGPEGLTEKLLPESQANCFYQGHIRNDSASSVAVSTCQGLKQNEKL
eukprot:g22592.t1